MTISLKLYDFYVNFKFWVCNTKHLTFKFCVGLLGYFSGLQQNFEYCLVMITTYKLAVVIKTVSIDSLNYRNSLYRIAILHIERIILYNIINFCFNFQMVAHRIIEEIFRAPTHDELRAAAVRVAATFRSSASLPFYRNVLRRPNDVIDSKVIAADVREAIVSGRIPWAQNGMEGRAEAEGALLTCQIVRDSANGWKVNTRVQMSGRIKSAREAFIRGK